VTPRARGFFVTGTDTGVGKTVVACALVRALRAEGIDIAAMKPAETGVGEAGPLDAIALREAAGGTDDLADVCPLQFALPTAPNVAAQAEGSKVDLARVDRAFARIASRHAAVVVEGAGGLLVPTTDDETMADLASRLGLPLLLVARAALGTINHTRLCLDAIAARGLDCVGVVISHSDGRLSHADERNLDWLRRWLGERLLGEIRPLAPGAVPELAAIRLEPFLERLA
jgi:dethiobiotin synthetase